MKTLEDSTIHWLIVVSVATVQNGLAIFAVYSSSQDRLSDGACMGGYLGGLASITILAVVVIWAIILAMKTFRDATWHHGLKPLGAVALSSLIAFFVGMNAVLGCTV